MGTSTVAVYKADGTTQNFNTSIYPARADKYATTPEKDYEATVGHFAFCFVYVQFLNHC